MPGAGCWPGVLVTGTGCAGGRPGVDVVPTGATGCGAGGMPPGGGGCGPTAPGAAARGLPAARRSPATGPVKPTFEAEPMWIGLRCSCVSSCVRTMRGVSSITMSVERI